MDTKILEKVKKCLALSASSEPHEAAAALRQAQALMAKYNIDQTVLNRHEIGETSIQSKFSVSKPKPYELKVINLVAKAFGCMVIFTKSRSYRENPYGHWTLIGIKSQMEIAEYTVAVLLRQMIKGRAKFISEMPEHWDRQHRSIEANGWCVGWASAIEETVHDFAVPDGVQAEIKKIVEDRCGKRIAKVSRASVGFRGHAQGLEEGKKVSLHRPMNETKHKLIK